MEEKAFLASTIIEPKRFFSVSPIVSILSSKNAIRNNPPRYQYFTKIEEKFKEDTRVIKIENKVHGKIINLIITLQDDVDVGNAKAIGNSTIGMFEQDELKYYALQVYLKKENQSLNNFPIVGYKGVDTENLIYSKDREITQIEEKTDEK